MSTQGEYSFGGLADTLPAVSGLFVDGVGTILTPLCAEQAEKLIAVCKKSPFGHNLDTKMDENVRKSWQLEANLAQFKNPLWQAGIDKLRKVIADRLGYADVPLECVLYKLLVYGEGGHFVKHQDTEKEDGMITTLVVQPPSVHEGGDLVVYRDGKPAYRHDFGKADGSAAYAPHYAVHYADAEHALEKVTKGFRLVLVYSICLPVTMRHLERKEYKLLSEDLAQAISSMGKDQNDNENGGADRKTEQPANANDAKDDKKDKDGKGGEAMKEKKDDDKDAVVKDDEDDSFALLLDHEYTMNSIMNLGSGAFKGIDRARFHALEEANALVAPEKKLRFFIAQLVHDVRYYNDGGGFNKKEGHRESITWYSLTGEELGKVRGITQKLNLLNPGHEAFEELWWRYGIRTKEGGYTGNAGSTEITTYARYAIVAWRMADHVEKALRFMPIDVAADAMHGHKPVDGAALRTLFGRATIRLKDENGYREDWESEYTLSRKFREVVCDLLVDAGDPSVVSLFFKDYCGTLGYMEGDEALVLSITKILRAYDWGEIGDAVSKKFRDSVDEGGLSALEMILRVADGLDSGAAQKALYDMAGKQTATIKDEELLKNADPSLLGPSIQYLSQYESSADEKDEKAAVVVSVVPKRIKWLKDQIEVLEKPFSWEMREAQFPDNAEIQSFLRGPEESMETKEAKKFDNLQEAGKYAAKWMNEKQTKCSFEMEAHEKEGEASVTITKTRDWFLKQQSDLVLYRKELRRLVDRYDNSSGDDGEKKRTRLA
ncbi:hypothetical protein PF010_g23574 [Phytophthora fragariae]|uniref:Fe2OG dioxygenase domain-containing protein n=1 Tax=Phytophthora fragariae TaxID=53985 RepID=A0A6G0K525_9STRA|nr:hypothetical protein PF010_g23574 [Phytophthora fragariae]